MIASGVHAAVRLMAGSTDNLAELAGRVNRYLSGATADNRFATFAMVMIEPDGAVRAINAGHLPVLIRRTDGTVESIESGGLPLGILAAATYSESTAKLQPGDVVILYTDGLTEAEDAEEEEFGIKRVAEVAAGLQQPTAEGICEAILEAVDHHTDGSPLQDDATLLVVERLKA
jgi:sigma-B regulation protein RsbU (phosphoserine phosphatase)